MPNYVEIDLERLSHLHEGLELLEMVDRDAIAGLDLCVYGITTNAGILDAAREAIADNNDVSEEDVQVSEIAVAIPISSDTIYALNGSGFRLKREEFAYNGSGGEGVRSLSFVFANFKPQVTLQYFTKLAIASSESWLDDFLRKYGTGAQTKVTPAVHRNQEATTPAAPAAPTVPPAAPPVPGVPKQTSQLGGVKFAQFLDEFLS